MIPVIIGLAVGYTVTRLAGTKEGKDLINKVKAKFNSLDPNKVREGIENVEESLKADKCCGKKDKDVIEKDSESDSDTSTKLVDTDEY